MSVNYLVARKLLLRDDASSNRICPADPPNILPLKPVAGDLTFHDLATILSGACGIVSLLVSCITIIRHATNYSNPIQQRQVIRILMLVPWIAIFSFLIVWQEDAGEYLIESLDFGCSIAISSFLLLLCDYILSNPNGFETLFGVGASKLACEGALSPPFLKRTWYQVLQYFPVAVIVWLATVITLTANIYCANSNSPHFAHIWLQVIKVLSTTIAVLACLRFYRRNREQLAPHKVLLKFFAFKGIIGLNALQTLVIGILVGDNVITPTDTMTYHDGQVALPSLILSCELPIFAVLLFFAFPISVYKSEGMSPAAGPVTAMVQAFNVTDLMSSFVRGPMRLLREQQWGMQRAMSFPLRSDRDGMVVNEGSYNRASAAV